jgi:hypothetical protein
MFAAHENDLRLSRYESAAKPILSRQMSLKHKSPNRLHAPVCNYCTSINTVIDHDHGPNNKLDSSDSRNVNIVERTSSLSASCSKYFLLPHRPILHRNIISMLCTLKAYFHITLSLVLVRESI